MMNLFGRTISRYTGSSAQSHRCKRFDGVWPDGKWLDNKWARVKGFDNKADNEADNKDDNEADNKADNKTDNKADIKDDNKSEIGQLTNEQGFTLIEFLMVIGLLGLLMVAIQQMLTTGMDVFNREQAESGARRQLYYAAEQLVKVVRNTPASNILLSGGVAGVYDELTLTSASGTVTRFYLVGDRLYRDELGVERVVAEQIAELRFAVKCEVAGGTFESYSTTNRRLVDQEANFTDHDPALRGMVVQFESHVGGVKRYIYRKITDSGANWLELDAGFAPGFSPTSQNYAIGKTYQIYVKSTEISGKQKGTEVTTGVAPRF